MSEALLHLLTALFEISGLLALIGYFPTIKDLYLKKKTANAMTYLIWGFTTLVTFLYGLFILHDLVFNLVMGSQVVACATVLILLMKKNS